MSEIDSSWMDTKHIKIEDLFKMHDETKWDALNNYVEGTLAKISEPFFSSTFAGLTQGEDPTHDFTYKDKTKVEVKTTRGPNIYVETLKVTSTGEIYASGLALTEADYHIFLRGGSPVKKGEENVFKVHVIKTSEIRKAWLKAKQLADGNLDKEKLHNKVFTFKLDIFNMEDGLIGYFPSVGDGIVDLNPSKFTPWKSTRDRNGNRIK